MLTRCHPLTGRTPTKAGDVRVRAGGSTGLIGSFGMTRNGGRKMHEGVDYLSIPGAPVFAAHNGVVLRDGEQQGGEGYGFRLYLVGDAGAIETRYAHLSGEIVKQQDSVRAGQLIGWVGRSGNIDDDCPTHLHFEVRRGNNREPVDPETWLYLDDSIDEGRQA